MAPSSWQRATKFREHLSFISTDKVPVQNLKSAFSPVTPTPPPPQPIASFEVPPRPEPIKVTIWNKNDSTFDLERGAHRAPETPRSFSRFSFWRNKSTAGPWTPPPATPIPLKPWSALNIRKRPQQNVTNEKKKKNNSGRCWLILLIIVLLYLLGNSVFLNIRVLQPPAAVQNTTQTAVQPTSSVPTPTPTTTPTAPPSQAVLDCLSQFKLNAAKSPTSYPCSTCAPVLAAVPNDLSTSTKNPQTTGQGNVLQFCALSDVVAATTNGTLQNVGWMKDTDFCSWNGLTCDSSGRVTTMALVFPGVPATLPSSLVSLIALQNLQITGNSNIPAGAIQGGSVLSLPSLQSIQLESTGLTGPLPDDIFSTSSNLTQLTLARNANLGQSLPSSVYNLSLTSLVVNSQSLNMPLTSLFNSASLAKSLHTLDLSSNSLSGTIPPLDAFANLVELHLDSNQLNDIPSSFPTASLEALTLASNAGLSGSVPNALCSSTLLKNCDLRSTQLGVNGANATTGSCGPCQFGSM